MNSDIVVEYARVRSPRRGTTAADTGKKNRERYGVVPGCHHPTALTFPVPVVELPTPRRHNRTQPAAAAHRIRADPAEEPEGHEVSNTSANNPPRCGVPRKTNGLACRQPVDVWPCRYHDTAAFNALFAALTDAVRAAGGVAAFIREHSAAAR